MTREGLLLWFLTVAGFIVAFGEDRVIDYLVKTYLHQDRFAYQVVVWTVVFGLFHAMLFLWIYVKIVYRHRPY